MHPVNKPGELAFESERLDEHLRTLSMDKPVATFELGAINELLGGVYPGLVCALGAMPGTGKTTLLLQLAEELAAKGHLVLFMTAELPVHKLLAKSLARLSGGALSLGAVAGASLPDSIAHPTYQEAVNFYRERIAPNIVFTGTMNVTELGHIVSECIRLREVAPVLFIDYLQLVATSYAEPYADERLAISACVKGFRDIANCYGCPIFAASSITRNSYCAKNPNLSIFGGAAVIEYSVDAALYLAEDKDAGQFQHNPSRSKPVVLTALKNRYGTLDSVRLSFDGEHATFSAQG